MPVTDKHGGNSGQCLQPLRTGVSGDGVIICREVLIPSGASAEHGAVTAILQRGNQAGESPASSRLAMRLPCSAFIS